MSINKTKAREIAMEWHGGFGTALYQFGSSGVILPGNAKRYVAEINDNIRLASPAWKIKLRNLKAYLNDN